MDLDKGDDTDINSKSKASAYSRFSLFNIFYFIGNFCILFSYLVHDQESGFNDTLIKKGVRESLLWISWAIVYGIIIILSSIFGSYFNIMNSLSFIHEFIILFSYGIGCCSLAFLLFTSIKDSKTSIRISKFIILGFLLINYSYFQYYFEKENDYKAIFSFAVYLLFPLSYVNLIVNIRKMKYTTGVILYNNFNYSNYEGLFGYLIPFIISIIFTLVLTFVFYYSNKNKLQEASNETSKKELRQGQKQTESIDNIIKNFEQDGQTQNDRTVGINVNVDFKNLSSFQQIRSVMSIKFKLFLNNEKLFVLNIIIPVCLIIIAIILLNKFTNFIGKELKDVYVNVNPHFYENIKWFKESNTSGIGLDILNIIEKDQPSISVTSVDYEKSLIINSETPSSEVFVGGFGSSINENENCIEFNIYCNYEYPFSLPVTLNLIDNAILHYQNIDKEITVNYYNYYFNKLLGNNKFINDSWLIIEVMPLTTIYYTVIIIFISIMLSYSISCFGPLIIKDKETNLTSKLYSKGLKPINYWIGVLLGDLLYMMIPSMIVLLFSLVNLPLVDIFNKEYIGLTMIVNILCIVHCLLFQYIICSYLKNHRRISRIFSLVIPLLTIVVSKYKFSNLYVKDLSGLKSIDTIGITKNLNEIPVVKALVQHILIIIFYPPSNFLLYLFHFMENIYGEKWSFKPEDIQKFSESSSISKIISNKKLILNNRLYISNLFFSSRTPKLSNILYGINDYTLIIQSIVVGIIFCGICIYILEKIKAKKNKKENKKEQ